MPSRISSGVPSWANRGGGVVTRKRPKIMIRKERSLGENKVMDVMILPARGSVEVGCIVEGHAGRLIL